MDKEERAKYMREYRKKNKKKINLKDRIRKQLTRAKDRLTQSSINTPL